MARVQVAACTDNFISKNLKKKKKEIKLKKESVPRNMRNQGLDGSWHLGLLTHKMH